MEALQGGRENAIYRSNEKVYRPKGAWSETVQGLLAHIAQLGFVGAPHPFGFDADGNEILSYVEGDVANYPLQGNVASKAALVSAARLLRQYHDASQSFITSNTDPVWMLPTREPAEVVCHGDYAPYNVVLNGEQTVGIIDFDTAHPAPRSWDLAYSLYCWAPFKTNEFDAMGDIVSQSLRAKQFCDAYGFAISERSGLVELMIERLQALVDFMHDQAAQGHAGFIENINDGHHLAYLADIDYLRTQESYITARMIGDE